MGGGGSAEFFMRMQERRAVGRPTQLLQASDESSLTFHSLFSSLSLSIPVSLSNV